MSMNIAIQLGRKNFDDSIKSITQEYARLEERVKSLTEEQRELQNKLSDKYAVDKEIARLNDIIDEQNEQLRFGFGVTWQEHKTIKEWLKKHNVEKHVSETVYYGAIGGRITYIFAPTSIGMVGKIKCSCGEEFCFKNI